MTQETTRRGFTREDVNKNKSHAEVSLISISSTLKTQGGDPEPKRFRMTLWNNGAFTLIELLVVVLIIVILAAVALPQYNKAVRKAQSREILNSINVLDKGLANYYLEHGNFSKQVGSSRTMIGAADLDIEIPELKYSKYETTDGQSSMVIKANKLGEYFYREGSDYSTPYVTFVLPDKETTLTIVWKNGKRYSVYFRGDIGKYFSTKTVAIGTGVPVTVLDEPALTVN